MKKCLKYIIILLSILIIACTVGCGSDSDDCDGCNNEIDDMYATYGAPEEVNTYDSGNYHSYSYWYWCNGFSYTFTWYDCDCDVSLYTFSPICY